MARDGITSDMTYKFYTYVTYNNEKCLFSYMIYLFLPGSAILLRSWFGFPLMSVDNQHTFAKYCLENHMGRCTYQLFCICSAANCIFVQHNNYY